MEVVNLKLITSSSHRFKPNKTRSKIKRRAKPVFAERPSEKPTQFSGPNEIERIKETTNRKSDANKKLDTQAKKRDSFKAWAAKPVRSRNGRVTTTKRVLLLVPLFGASIRCRTARFL